MSGAEATVIRVLLAEHGLADIVAVRALLARFADARFVVEEAHSVSTVLQRLAKGGIEIVLLDSALPGGDWVEALARLRSRFPETPVILLAAMDDKSVIPSALRMGAKDCIVKDAIDSHLLGRMILRHTGQA